MVRITIPDAVLVAFFSFAALSTKSCPCFFASSAPAAALFWATSFTLGPQASISTCGLLYVTASVRPALTIASSSGFKANGLMFFPSRSPSAYRVFWSSVSSLGEAAAAGPEVWAQAIIEPRQRESAANWMAFLIIVIQHTLLRTLTKAPTVECHGDLR